MSMGRGRGGGGGGSAELLSHFNDKESPSHFNDIHIPILQPYSLHRPVAEVVIRVMSHFGLE